MQVLDMPTPLADLHRFKGERTSFTQFQAHVYLLGRGHSLTFDQTKGYLKLLEEQGNFSDRRADEHNRTIYVTHD